MELFVEAWVQTGPLGQGLKHRQDGLFLKFQCGSVQVVSKEDQLGIQDRNPGQE